MKVIIWDVAKKIVFHELQGHHASVLSLQWSPDGKILASGALDRRIKLWDTEGGLKTLELDDMGSQVQSFSPDIAIILFWTT
jgi:WD40 repeat protein